MTQTLRRRLAALEMPVDVGAITPLSGGDSGAGLWRVDGTTPCIVKRDSPQRVAGEADGLRALRDACRNLIVPEVLAEDGDLLIMQAMEDTGKRDGVALGEGLRQLHRDSRDADAEHGWSRNNACGLTPQSNEPLADGRAFQRDRRLLPLLALCREQGLLDAALAERIERAADSLERWLSDIPPSLVHGDLWSGNVLFTPQGPAIIDPAVYRHYPEVDVAMLTLFGGPGDAFFEAYWDGERPSDWERREALFQLYPLLNHLYLFGGTYRHSVARAVDRILAG
ncbi:fructosamine kinase family protein [Salinicola corii]|uniref:Fructosamine kinase family protein n=1 Tax=Salinicola corii TaxID=2606937 RepID=A0A640WB03_9GAMM|nr:fructosamine kinase family protein [Salinicola corii]KAA0016478.1 fructosamine kinase family protein [Salinicola corii]